MFLKIFAFGTLSLLGILSCFIYFLYPSYAKFLESRIQSLQHGGKQVTESEYYKSILKHADGDLPDAAELQRIAAIKLAQLNVEVAKMQKPQLPPAVTQKLYQLKPSVALVKAAFTPAEAANLPAGNDPADKTKLVSEGISASPESIDFYIGSFTQNLNGTVMSDPQVLTLLNTTPNIKKVGGVIAPASRNARFDILDNQCVGELLPNQSCQIKLKFKTKKNGKHEGQLAIYINNKKFEVKLRGYY